MGEWIKGVQDFDCISAGAVLKELLDLSCWNPADWEDYQKWSQQQRLASGNDYSTEEIYHGWRLFNIQLHCKEVVVRAKLGKDGYYVIDKIMISEH